MRIITKEVFSFEELSSEAKEKAISVERRLGFDSNFMTDVILESFTEKLDEIGFPTDEIFFSLSNCQGDGVAFYGEIDIEKYLKDNIKYKRILELKDEITFNIARNSWSNHYSHYNTMTLEIDYNDIENKTDIELIQELEIQLQEFIKDKSKELEKIGYDIIEDIESDEAIIETIQANEYEFYSDGELI